MPQRIGKYEIRGELGKGGFGQVYLGFDPTMNRLVAIKVLTSADPDLIARFRTEAMTAGNLRHKNIVTIHEFGEDAGGFYLVMEHLQGRDLQKVMAEPNSLTLADKIRIMSQVAEGLYCAHQNGIVHRDVKPANIMLLNDGSVKVMDFGIARLTRYNAARLTQSGALIGTISYMAPEQLKGLEADALCDIWAFGMIYYELLTGAHPCQASDPAVAMYRILEWQPEPIRNTVSDCPEALDNVVMKLVAKDRDVRYQSLEDVLFDTTPILVNLESKRAQQLISGAETLINEGRLDEAQQAVRRVLAMDPSREDGRALWQKVQNAIKLRGIRVQVEELLARTSEYASAHDYANAIRTLTAALRLDPGNTLVQTRLAELEDFSQRHDTAIRLLNQARRDAEQSHFTAAFQAASDALNAEPHNAEAQTLVADLQRRMTERDAQRQLSEGMAKVEGLLVLDSFQEADELLAELAQKAPGDPQVRELAAHARRQRELYQRRLFVQSEIELAKEAIKRRDLVTAVEKLKRLSAEPSHAREIAQLLSYAQQELDAERRAAKIKSLGNQAWALLNGKQFAEAASVVEAALASFPDSAVLLKLQQAIRTERAKEERRVAVQMALDESAAAERTEQLDKAAAILDKIARQYPDEPALKAARQRVAAAIEQKRARLAEFESGRQRAQSLLDRGELALAAQLLQELSAQYPGNPQIAALLQRAEAEHRKALERQQREVQERERAEAERLRQENDRRQKEAQDRERAEAERRTQEELQRKQEAERRQKEAEERERAEAESRRVEAERRRKEAEDVERAEAERQRLAELARRRTAIEGLCAEIRAQLSERQWDQSRAALSRAKSLFGPEPQFASLEAQLVREQGRHQQIEQARLALRDQNWNKAASILQDLISKDPQDGEARNLLAQTQAEQLADELRRRRQTGRAEAEQYVRQLRFDDAIHCLERLQREFPDHAGINAELQAAIEAKQTYLRRQAYAAGRQQADALLNERRFDEAIGAIQKLMAQFPADGILRDDLKAAETAKQEYVRKEHYNAGRRKAAQAMSERRFNDAIESLRTLFDEFPSDPVLQADLDSAIGAERLQQFTTTLEREVQTLEKLYRKGDAQSVFERTGNLPVELQENARVREFRRWAEEELSRPKEEQRESAETLRRKYRTRVVLGFAVAAVVVLAILITLFLRQHTSVGTAGNSSPTELSLDPGEILLEAVANGPSVSKTIKILSRPDAAPWSVSAPDGWPSVQPSSGMTPAEAVVSVDPRGREAGVYLAHLVFTTNQGAGVTAAVTLNVTAPRLPSPVKQPSSNPVGPSGPGGTKPKPPPPQDQPQPTQPISPVPLVATQPPQPKPPPAIVNCNAPDYTRPHSGTFTWIGPLAAGEEKVIDQSTSAVSGQRLPGCGVTVTASPNEIEIADQPSPADGFRRIRIRNNSKSAVPNVQFSWTVN